MQDGSTHSPLPLPLPLPSPAIQLTRSPLEPHPLLAQIPLTVSPFISLPSATTLPYTYKSLPSTLPPTQFTPATTTSSSTSSSFIPTPHAGPPTSPQEIIFACHSLQSHIQKLQEDAERSLQMWEREIRERELAEKRRVAPGWLDRGERILEPVKAGAGRRGGAVGGGGGGGEVNLMDTGPDEAEDGGPIAKSLTQERRQEGEDLDRAFGGMGLR
ncbi:MAG: hypothetical protein MMC33_009331 [Icmadophila ericetorum]|nr:hypothetical protein [Icmadophila ericetorum]